MQATRESIQKLLLADSMLQEISPGGVYYGAAKHDAKFPFTIFQQVADRWGQTFADEYGREIYLIKGVGAGAEGLQNAEVINERVQIVMKDAPLHLGNKVLLYCRRDEERSGISIRELYSKADIYQVGTHYRIEFE